MTGFSNFREGGLTSGDALLYTSGRSGRSILNFSVERNTRGSLLDFVVYDEYWHMREAVLSVYDKPDWEASPLERHAQARKAKPDPSNLLMRLMGRL